MKTLFLNRFAIAPLVLAFGLSSLVHAESTLRFCIRSEPRTFHPLLVSDDASETIRYLTGGVLIRVNRRSQQLQPGLASHWTVGDNGRRIDFVLRENIRFSDGTPFGPADVVYTVGQLMSPELHSPVADSFGGEGKLTAQVTGAHSVSIRLSQSVAGLPALFDDVAILSAKSPLKEKAVLGPFQIASHKPGVSILLRRNPNYWEHDASGKPLPYLDTVQIDVQQNREGEALRLKRGEIDLIQNLDPELFDRLSQNRNPEPGTSPLTFQDAGPSLDSELIWFNMNPAAPLPAYKKAWFNDPHFRRAISLAIDRAGICRVIYRGHAIPALGPVSPSNKFWFNTQLPARPRSLEKARQELAAAGFSLSGDQLHDTAGNPVEFSLISNAGNRNHERMLALIQQDLAQVGVHLNVVSLEFASILERIARSFNYEACLMSLTNVGLDPNEQMNVWLSSASNHQWNPNQKKPATPWEARLDQLMQDQAASLDPARRKELFDEVQAIARDQEPFVYLVHPNVLEAVSARVKDVSPAVLHPQLYWNIERQQIASSEIKGDRK